MKHEDILKDLNIYLFNRTASLKKGIEDLSENMYRVLADNKRVPPKAFELIPDKRYHKEFDIVYGFMFELGKIEEPSFDLYFSWLEEEAKKIRLGFMNISTIKLLMLHTLVVEYFHENWEKLYD